MIDVRNVCVAYDDFEVIKGVSFSVEAGKMVFLLGANGSGKSTILKALNGSLPIAKGEILFEAKPIQKFSRLEIARRIAVVAQESETRFPITVQEFVLSGRYAFSSAFSFDTEEDLEVATWCMKLCDLSGYEARLMNQLSGGERQRAVLARAFATQAPVLILDEPTNNLDLLHQISLFQLVKERCKNSLSCAVIVTHDLNLASEFADEIVLLKKGEMIAKGEPKQVLTEENLQDAFGIKVLLDENPVSKKTRVTLICENMIGSLRERSENLRLPAQL